MTIICYRDGFMAADSARWSPGHHIVGHREKIFRLDDGGIAAAAGASGEVAAFKEWMLSGRKTAFKATEGFVGMFARRGENVSIVDSKGAVINDLVAPFYAEGAASEMAMGAMAAGASAWEAVAICIQYHAWAAGTVQVEAVRYLDFETAMMAASPLESAA